MRGLMVKLKTTVLLRPSDAQCIMDTKIYGVARYYNNIGGLQELYRLCQNQKLQELDLRLNPVARNEPDYRLFLIHMLPNLRRLDDRAVRDSERKAALMHFSSDQAASLGEPQRRSVPSQDKHPNPRAEHVKSLAKPASVLDDDDPNLMDLIGRTSSELAGITGSAASGPHIQDYSPESVRRMNIAGVGLGEQPTSAGYDQSASSDAYITPTSVTESESALPAFPVHQPAEALQQRYPNIPVIVATPPSPQHKDSGKTSSEQPPRKNRVQFADDANLKFQDEIDAYTSYKAKGQFTPNPGSGVPSNRNTSAGSGTQNPPRPDTAFGNNPYYPSAPTTTKPQHQYSYDGGQAGVELYSKLPQDKKESAVYQELPSTHSIAPSSITAASSVFHAGNTFMSQDGTSDPLPPPTGDPCDPLVHQISDLVDRYWNGAKSLQTNNKFQVQLNSLLRNHLGSSLSMDAEREQRLSQVEEEVTRLRGENMQLRERGAFSNDLENADDNKLKSMLIRAQRDLSILRSRLQMSMDENRGLQDKVAHLEKNPSSVNKEGFTNVEELESIKKENENLRQEISSMSGRMKQSSQLQELANMLQDSHKSLVQTNEHLLRELEETRTRHDQEVRQLHWSYDQLKSSVGYMPKMGNASTVLNGKST